jgi:hypothetical protein
LKKDVEKSFIYFSGAWIEGMYLGAVNATKNEKAGAVMAAQFYMLEDIIKGLNKVKAEGSSDYDGLISQLEDLKNTYAGLATVKAAGEDAMYDVTLKADEVKTIAEKVITIRKEIVKI